MSQIKQNMPRPRPGRVFSSPLLLAAFGLGTGLMPLVPGTWGTLVGLALYFLIGPLGPIPYLIITFVLFVLGVYLCGEAARRLGVHDHPGIVWDEIVGYLVTMLPVCAVFYGNLFWPAVGFVLFRLFDIFKPLGIRRLDRRVGGGFGIMVDDLVAGLYAAICLGAIYWGLGAVL